jgi:hypothetical protein
MAGAELPVAACSTDPHVSGTRSHGGLTPLEEISQTGK